MTTPKTITAWVDRGVYEFEAGQLLPNGWQGTFISAEHVEDRVAELEAKLAKAVDALEFYDEVLTVFASENELNSEIAEGTHDRDGGKLARATIAELKCGDV